MVPAIHEFEGRYSIPQSVELGLNKVYELGRPVVLNTLRFPLSVIRTFGKEWYKISNKPIPTVLMNGSQIGYVVQSPEGEFGYEEILAFPLHIPEIESALKTVHNLLADGVSDLLVFYYPRNWQQGEIIWTPVAEKIGSVQQKYLSASTVYSSTLEQLTQDMLDQEICMIFLLIDIPQDKLMAYQHTKRSNFFTHEGVDKRFGSEQIAKALNFELMHSVGAGDSEMDTFLASVGLAVHVGNPYLKFEGLVPAVKLNSSSELGELLFELAAMQRSNDGEFIVRIANSASKINNFIKKQWVTEKAAGHGVPVPEILEVGNEVIKLPYMIQHKMEGEEAINHPDRLTILHDLGNYARKIHAVTTTGFGNNFNWSGNKLSKQETWAEFLNNELQVSERISFLQKHKLLSGEKCKKLVSLVVKIKNWEIAPSLNHCDLRLKNIIVNDKGKIQAILDWENSSSNVAPYWDLSIALHDLSIDGKQKFLEGYGLDIKEFKRNAYALSVFNLINYIPSLQRIIARKQTARLELYRLRLNGSLDLFSL